jgi:sec-independent protein translocase protein TatA
MIKWLVVLVVVFVIFGAGKIPQAMNDIGKGIKALKDGLQGDDTKKPEEPKQIADGDKDKNA